MAVNLNVISQFDAKGLDRAQSELDKLAASSASTSSKLMAGAATAGAGILVGAGAVAAGLYAIGSSFDEAFDNIRVSTGATGPALEALQEDMKAVAGSVPASFDNAGIAIAKFSSKLGLTGDPLRQMSAQVLELSRMTETDLAGNIEAVSSVMQNFGVGADQQSGKLDLLFRASQASGVSVAELAGTMSGAGVVLRQVGMSFDESAAFLATLGKAGVDAADVMPSLSKALATAAKGGKDASTVFKETFDAIQNSPDKIKAAQIAMDVFGVKGGTKFAAMIREGKLSYEEMQAAITGGNDGILKAGVETQDFGEKWMLIKNRIFIALQPIASKLFDFISTSMNALGPILDDVVGAFKALFAAFKAGDGDITSTGLAGVFEHIGLIARQAFDIIASAIDVVKNNLEIVVPIVGTLSAAFLLYKTYMVVTATVTKVAAAAQAAFNAVMAANPISLVVIAIALLVAGIIMLWRNWDKVWNWIKEHKAIAGIIAVLFPILIPIFAIVAAIKFLVANWETVWSVIQTVTGVAVDITVAYFKAIIAYIMFMWNNFQILWDIVQNVWSGILTAINAAWTVIQVIWDAIEVGIGFLITYYQLLWNVVQTVWSAITGAISTAWGLIQTAFNNIKNGIATVWGFFQTAKDIIGSVFTNIADAISGPFKTAFNFISDAWNNTVGNLSWSVPGWVPIIGGNKIEAPKLPRFETGGIFNTAMGGGSGLAVLHDNEMILNPQQQKALFSGGGLGDVNVYVNQSDASPYEIGKELVWAMRVSR